MFTHYRFRLGNLVTAAIALCIAACGGGSNSNPAPATYTVSGKVSGLAIGDSLILQDNGEDSTTVSDNGAVSFSTPIASGAAYSVTVSTQPQGQRCTVSGGSGVISGADVTFAVSCGAAVVENTWAWISGSNQVNQAGTYGNKGSASASNVPGGRYDASTWTDASGNLWMFGGSPGGSATGPTIFLGDLWEFADGQWTWVGGSSTPDSAGVYGVMGIAAAGNTPGARAGGSAWTDAAGNLWLFGGVGIAASPGPQGYLQDLWEFHDGQWTWVAGPNGVGAISTGIYGTKGSSAPGNLPGGRAYANTWTDASGNLWLFGGIGSDSTGSFVELNDLWEYSSGEWTWIAGPDTGGASGSYGTLGVASAGNTPGARLSAVSWIDSSGTFWLFGGYGYDSAGNSGSLNDLWKFSAGTWTWVGGSNIINGAGVYGSLGTAAAGNLPGARSGAVAWTDASGNFWMFGGGGLGASTSAGQGYLNDLWKYSAGQWTWIGGSDTVGSVGSYGIEGTAVTRDVPMSRSTAMSWTDRSGNLWLFGGTGIESTFTSNTTIDALNDLWRYTP